jgi:hypothetical protein
MEEHHISKAYNETTILVSFVVFCLAIALVLNIFTSDVNSLPRICVNALRADAFNTGAPVKLPVITAFCLPRILSITNASTRSLRTETPVYSEAPEKINPTGSCP